jgi:hypothetical protein
VLCHCSALSEAEKASLRQGLTSNFHEPINQIATQLAVLISKVARYANHFCDIFGTALLCVWFCYSDLIYLYPNFSTMVFRLMYLYL